MSKKKTQTPTGYVIGEEDREVGTLLAAVAKKNRDIYERFKEEAAARGLKTSEAVEEALRLWTLSKTMRDIDPETLIAAINFVNYMREQAVKELLALGQLFTSEFFKVQMGIASQIAQQTAPEPQEQPKQSSPDELMKQQLKLQMMQTILPLYMGIMQQLIKALNPAATNIPITPPTTQTQTKKPIIVEE